MFSGVSSGITTAGVSSNPNAVPSVGCADGASWNNEGPDFVTLNFQVSEHLLEYHASIPSKEAANVLAQDVARMCFPYKS